MDRLSKIVSTADSGSSIQFRKQAYGSGGIPDFLRKELRRGDAYMRVKVSCACDAGSDLDACYAVHFSTCGAL